MSKFHALPVAKVERETRDAIAITTTTLEVSNVTLAAGDAIRGAKGGLYTGTTYEGLKNYTAYDVSTFSGWSTHLAVTTASIDTPTRWSFVAAAIAAPTARPRPAVLTR